MRHGEHARKEQTMRGFTEGGLALSSEAGVVWLHFERPERLNAIDIAMAQAFDKAASAIAAEPSVRVVVLTGAGRAFMAGGDLNAFHSHPEGGAAAARAIIDPLHNGLATLASIDAPVIAALQGAVAGAGVSIALAA